MVISPWIVRYKVLAGLLKHVIRYQYIRVNLLSSYWVEFAHHLKVFLYHFTFVGVPTLDDHWVLHYVVCNCTFQKVWHVNLPSIQCIPFHVFMKASINILGILHSGGLLGELHCHEVFIVLHLLLQIEK